MSSVVTLLISLIFSYASGLQSNLVSEMFKIKCRKSKRVITVIIEKNKFGCQVKTMRHGLTTLVSQRSKKDDCEEAFDNQVMKLEHVGYKCS